MKNYKGILLIGLTLISIALSANIKLPALVGNHMVLQQQTKVNIWGWASPGETISIAASWANQPVITTAQTDSSWLTTIETPAAGGPYSIILSGENTINLTDIMLGEVWICSGQSNMEKTIGIKPNQLIKS